MSFEGVTVEIPEDLIEEIMGRYNTREMVEACEDMMKSPLYEPCPFTPLAEGICASFRKKQTLTERQYRALATHIASREI